MSEALGKLRDSGDTVTTEGMGGQVNDITSLALSIMLTH